MRNNVEVPHAPSMLIVWAVIALCRIKIYPNVRSNALAAFNPALTEGRNVTSMGTFRKG